MAPVYALSSVVSSFIAYLVANVTVVLQLIGLWFTFRKMGLPGWKGIIPFYGTYVLFQKLWDTKMFWRMIIYLGVYVGANLLSIPFLVIGGVSMNDSSVAGIILLVVGILILIASLVLVVLSIVIEFRLYKKLAAAFGLKDAWAWGLLFLPYVFLPIIGFHKRILYYGPVNQV